MTQPPKFQYSILAHTDSRLIAGQLAQGQQIKAADPSSISGEALRLVADEASILV